MMKKCHCERFSAKQSLKTKRLLRQKAPRNDNCGVFQRSVKENQYLGEDKLASSAAPFAEGFSVLK
jgi:hypothetical protein